MQDINNLKKPIGIIGGGQLARMLCMAAAKLGIDCIVYDPDIECPASSVCKKIFVGNYSDPLRLEEFAKEVGVITFEFENIDLSALAELSDIVDILPNINSLAISQDRIREKTYINSLGIKTAPWQEIKTLDDLHRAAKILDYPFILKTTRLGYDGKGQLVVHNFDDCASAFRTLEPKPLIAEKMINFSKEISVIAARNQLGNTVSFEPSENKHSNGILDFVQVPARIKPAVINNARKIATDIISHLDIVGIISVEMFVTESNDILVNEIAVRPHNSGHWTIDACDISQFELQIRAITGLPLPTPQRYNDATMKNLIGPEGIAMGNEYLGKTGAICHFYGKKSAKPGRKMGHITQLYRLYSLADVKGSM